MDAPASLQPLAMDGELALFDWLRARISRLMLEEIAAIDYGEEVAEHLAAINEQLDGSNPPLGDLAWNPKEVLELERWSEPDTAYLKEPPSGLRGHRKRLLACAILLRNAAYAQDEFFLETSASTVIQLARSAITLEEGAPQLALRFLLWFYGKQPHPALRPFVALAVLLLVGDIERRDADPGEICDWVVALEAQSRIQMGHEIESERWLIGLNCYEDRKGHRERWIDAAKAILGPTGHPRLIDVLERLEAR